VKNDINAKCVSYYIFMLEKYNKSLREYIVFMGCYETMISVD